VQPSHEETDKCLRGAAPRGSFSDGGLPREGQRCAGCAPRSGLQPCSDHSNCAPLLVLILNARSWSPRSLRVCPWLSDLFAWGQGSGHTNTCTCQLILEPGAPKSSLGPKHGKANNNNNIYVVRPPKRDWLPRGPCLRVECMPVVPLGSLTPCNVTPSLIV
jgi:hypothetical protein